MRLSFLGVLFVSTFASALVGCNPRDAIIRGTSDFTIATKGGGPAIVGAAPQEAVACWRSAGSSAISISLGTECVLAGRWSTTRDGPGSVVLDPNQRCTLQLNGETTAFTVEHGSFRYAGDYHHHLADGTLAGMSTDGARYVSLRYSGTEAGPAMNGTCDTAFQPAK